MKQASRFSNASNTSNTLLLISSIYSSFTKTERKVADSVQNDPEGTVHSTVTDLSENAGVGETSVIRFCRKIGFRGYHEFKLALAQNLVNVPIHIDGPVEDSDDTSAVIRKITANNNRMLQDTLDLINIDVLNKAVQTLLEAKKIYIYGVGSSGITALDAHYRFMRLGLNVEVHRDSHIIAMSSALVKKGEVVFGISTSGSTKDIIDSVIEAKKNKAKIICLTSHARSPITNYADIALLVPSRESPFQGGALTTKIAKIHVIDILSNLIMMQIKESTLDAIKKTANAVADKLY